MDSFNINGGEEYVPLERDTFIALVTAVQLDASTHVATFTGTTISGATSITSVSSFANIQIGMVLSGTGIPTGARVADFDRTGMTITTTTAATASGSVTITGAMYLYSWREEGFGNTSGAAVILDGPRWGGPSYLSSPIRQAAYENNNRLVDVPCYVTMKYRTAANGDLIYSFDAPATDNYAPDITYGDANQDYFVTINYYGSSTYPTYVTFGPNVYVRFTFPTYYNACVVIAGKAPAAPTTKPTITVGSSGTGAWGSGQYYAKITYRNISGAESGASPASDQTVSITGGPKFTIGLNNTPPADIVYWRVYITPANGAASSVTLQDALTTQVTSYDIPIGTTSWDFPGPYSDVPGDAPPTPSATQPVGCIVLPTCCGTPTWTGKYGEVAIDMCGATDACADTNPVAPVLYVQMTAPTGTNWKGIFDYTAITGYDCTQQQILGHAASTSGLQWYNVTAC